VDSGTPGGWNRTPASWWTSEDLKTADFSAVATAYLRLSTALMAKIAAVLGDAAAAERYRRVSERARVAWQAEFVADDGTVTPDTQATLVRALAFDLVSADLRHALARRLVELVRPPEPASAPGSWPLRCCCRCWPTPDTSTSPTTCWCRRRRRRGYTC
jgi:hypothetical protein